MKNLLKYGYSVLFLLIMVFQITGTTVHFYGKPSCDTAENHHSAHSISKPGDHCKICDNLSLLSSGFDIPKAWEVPSFFTEFASTCFVYRSNPSITTGITPSLRGPPVS